MIRRLILVLTAPVWLLPVVFFCFASAARSIIYWFRTGVWLLPGEHEAYWGTRMEIALDRWTRRMAA
jgi:hypothetical protein